MIEGSAETVRAIAENEPMPPAGIGDCGTAGAKESKEERGFSKVEIRNVGVLSLPIPPFVPVKAIVD